MKTFKQRTNASPLTIIRKRFGLTQQQLADQLRISRSTVMMAEQGKRSLPTSVLIQVARLEIKLAAEPLIRHHAIPHPAEKNGVDKCRRSGEMLFARESSCRLKLRKESGKLQTMTALYQKTREWLNVIESYIKENRNDAEVKGWWKKQQQSAIRTLNKCSLPAQILVRNKLALLEAEAELYRNMQERLKKELPDFFPKGVNTRDEGRH